MVQLFHKYKNHDFVYLIPLVALSLWVRLRYYFFLKNSGKGFPDSADSQWYLTYARSMLADFDLNLHMNDILYFGYNILLTILLAIFKDPVAILFVQTVVASLCVILVFKISNMLFNKTTAIIASLLYAYSWEITLWSTYILTDSFFISLLLLCVYFLLKSLESEKKLFKWLFVLTALYLCVFRPTGLLTIFFIMIYYVFRMDKRAIFTFIKKHKYAVGGVFTVAIAVFAYILAGQMLSPFIHSIQFNAKMVLYNVYAKGWIYDHPTRHDHFFRPDYTINIFNSLILSFLINNWDHVLILYAKRAFAFLGLWVWRIDVTNIVGLKKFFWNMLPWFLFGIGTLSAFINGVFRKVSIVWFIILAVFVFCITFFIDGMYRYKAPAVPFLAIAAAYGADSIIRLVIYTVRKYARKLWDRKKLTDVTPGQ
jgi:4-amino-4-deoxy-L-arabinose transferase-like glycosyltransferase